MSLPPNAQPIGVQISRNSKALIQPSLVAIYTPYEGVNGNGKLKPRQTGTGFLILRCGKPCFVTAKHSLYGRCDDEDPYAKHILANNLLQPLIDLNVTIHAHPTHDLAVVVCDGLNKGRCLPSDAIRHVPTQWMTIQGYLARDFSRAGQGVFPKPFVYTNKTIRAASGYVKMLYPFTWGIDSLTGERVRAPIPWGLSGCPMVDTVGLLRLQVKVVGVFTDKLERQGVALGEDSSALLDLLDDAMPCNERQST